MNMRMIGCVTILTLLLTACSAPARTSQPPTPTPIPSGMVDVGGYELFYQCSGQGSPAVILESGLGGGSGAWAGVIAGVAENTRVCAYDRANIGRSDKARTPRTFRDAVRDLHALLGTARIGGPYILVGHSLGVSLFVSSQINIPKKWRALFWWMRHIPTWDRTCWLACPQNRRMNQKA